VVKPCASPAGIRTVCAARHFVLEHILTQNGVDICLLSETFLNLAEAVRLAKYVCNRTDRPTTGSGTAILVRRGVTHHSVAVPRLTQV
jgi:hypothetical protein